MQLPPLDIPGMGREREGYSYKARGGKRSVEGEERGGFCL